MNDRNGFGPALRAHRERCGLTLDEIARSTKIKASLLAGLERNDLSQWPAGIFRRAFLRSYAVALGLAPEPLLEDFQRYFPEEGTPDPDLWTDQAPRPTPRLELVVLPTDVNVAQKRAVAAGLELMLVLAIGGFLSMLLGTAFWSTAGWTALIYYPVATGLTGRTARWRDIRWPAWLSRPRTNEEAAESQEYDPPLELPLREAESAAEPDPAADDLRPPQAAVH